jgi:cytosine/adenosine deaminase-related metal-dependent hydrolase
VPGAQHGPIDPPTTRRWALAGRVVTMDAKATVHERGVVYVERGSIAAVVPQGTVPDGLEDVTPLETGGTIFPGLIELHNHISYNALQLWDVPERYTNRDTWGNSAEYHRLVTAPMKTIGEEARLLPALARYVEVKALVGGVTTTQGIALFSAAGIRRFYRGIVRNVEQTSDPRLPPAGTRIGDVDARDPQAFLRELRAKKCVLLHLSEGTDAAAHAHFEALKLPHDEWAITAALGGIHCVALRGADFDVLAQRGAGMVWSPLSNLLLYGQTADVAAAKHAGSADRRLTIGLGSDWSPSGSKSLFGELKVARVVSEQLGGVFDDHELVALATANGARILRWDEALGTIEPGKYADLVVVGGQRGDPHGALFAGDERAIELVVIDGEPRYGTRKLMADAGPGGEPIRVGGEQRVLRLAGVADDPDVKAPTYAEAHHALKDALAHIKQIRLEQEHAAAGHAAARAVAPAELAAARGEPRLALDEFEPTHVTQRPHLPLAGAATGPLDRPAAAAAGPLSDLLTPLELDALTVADDPTFLDRITAQRNLPAWLPPKLRESYR